jgi:hypothetical protein
MRCLLACAACGWLTACALPSSFDPWPAELRAQLDRLGDRNWIVVAEASFPAHSRRGVRQTTSSREIPATLDEVLSQLETTEHVRPRIFMARELGYVANETAPGIEQLREQLQVALHGHPVTELDHQSLLTLMEDARQTYEVLVIRTSTALPYSSVFIELRHGYWDAEAEIELRDRIKAARATPTG